MGFKNKLYIYAENTPIRELLEKIAERANFKFTNFHNFHPFGVHGMVNRFFVAVPPNINFISSWELLIGRKSVRDIDYENLIER